MKRIARSVAQRAARYLASKIAPLLHDEPVFDPVTSGHLVMGRHSYYQPEVLVYPGDANKVVVGNFSSIAPDCRIYVGGEHRLDWVAAYGLRIALDLPGKFEDGNPWSRGDVSIGSDCWVTRGVWIRSGITIGDGAVVGAASVVTQDIGPFEIWAGNPARMIRKRFREDQIEALLEIRWWDWPDETIIERVDDLQGLAVDEFIAKYR